MNHVFEKIDKLKPLFDTIDKIVLNTCKILLILDILITTMSILGRYIPFIPDPAWSEEMVLTLMAYMAVLSASLAIRKRSHIRMTSFDQYLPKGVLMFLDLLSDVAVFILALIMVKVGFEYSLSLGAKSFYSSLPWLSQFWKYFPIPLAGIAMLFFELEIIYGHIKKLFGYGPVEAENNGKEGN